MTQIRPIRTAIRIIAAAALLAGFVASIGCGTPLEVDPSCDMGNVLVRATTDRHHYSFNLDCGAISGAVDAVYDTDTGIAQEQAKGPQGEAEAKWYCPHDPWSHDGVDQQTCNRLQAEATSFKDGPFNLSVAPPRPYSAYVLYAEQRHVLAKQLENAIRMNAEPPVATPEPPIFRGEATHIPGRSDLLDALTEALAERADLAVVSIAGPTTRVAGLSGTYTVTIKNEGKKSAPVELAIVFAGRLDQTGQIVAGAGLACEVKRGAAGINASVYCTGGTLAPNATVTVVVQGRGLSAGAGTLVVNVSPSRAVPEVTYDNNVKQLNVTVTVK